MLKQLISRPKPTVATLPYEFGFRMPNGTVIVTRARYVLQTSESGRRTPPTSGPLVGVEQ